MSLARLIFNHYNNNKYVTTDFTIVAYWFFMLYMFAYAQKENNFSN